MKLLVTGANGFVGKSLCAELSWRGHAVRMASRTASAKGAADFVLASVGAETNWSAALGAREVVIHLAARVHAMNDTSTDPLAEFRKVNVVGTLNLARQAAAVGVKRFVFISSVKVNGEATQLGSPFTADNEPAPLDAYGVSKMEAEQGLHEIASQTGMEMVVLRPPLVYGPGVKANFFTMMRWLQRGIPLPLGAIYNQRSLVALDNLIDLIVTCMTHPAAVNQTFLVSDGEDVSTAELLRRMGEAMNCPARLIPVPAYWLEQAASLIGKRDMAQRLCGSLQVDIQKTRQLLQWEPPVTLDQGLKKAAEGLAHEENV